MPSSTHSFRRLSDNTSEHGFTLIELMIVLAVLSIFAAIALPSFQQLIANNRTLSVNNELLDLLQYARTTAVMQHRNISLCQNDAAWSVRTTCEDHTQLRTLSLPSNISVSSSSQTLVFSNNGTTAAAKLVTCYGSDHSNGLTIDVQASGRAVSWARGYSGATSSDLMTSCISSTR